MPDLKPYIVSLSLKYQNLLEVKINAKTKDDAINLALSLKKVQEHFNDKMSTFRSAEWPLSFTHPCREADL